MPAPTSTRPPDGKSRRRLQNLFLPWRGAWRSDALHFDLLAGTTLAAYAVPSSIAYAQLAGMPVATGLYCYLFAGLAYALFGTSQRLAVGPTSAVALTLATTLSVIAAGDAEHYAALATTTALLVGLVALGAWLMRWGAIVHFISETVLTGFKIGAGTVIAASQLPLLLGITGGGHDFAGVVMHLARNLASAQPASLALGIAALCLLVAGQMRFPRWPVPLLVVIASVAFMELPAAQALGIATVGAIPHGLPAPGWPAFDWRELDTLLPLALACFFIAYNEASATARLLAARHDERFDPDGELLGLGAANIAIALGHGFPSGGGLSQSLVNDQAGARTPLSLVVCSGWMAVALLYLTGLFARLPQPLLAALVLASVLGMFRFDEMRQLLRVSRPEFVIALVTIAAVLGLGILKGVLVAAVFSLTMLIRSLADPECVLLGRLPGKGHFGALSRYPDALPVPGVMIVRANAALLYFNADNVKDRIFADIDVAGAPPRAVILDVSFSTDIDLSTARMLADVARKVRGDGIEFRLAEAHWRVRALLAKERLEPLLGDLARSYSIEDLVDGDR